MPKQPIKSQDNMKTEISITVAILLFVVDFYKVAKKK